MPLLLLHSEKAPGAETGCGFSPNEKLLQIQFVQGWLFQREEAFREKDQDFDGNPDQGRRVDSCLGMGLSIRNYWYDPAFSSAT